MDNATFTALIALGTALATGAGVKFFDYLIARRKGRDVLEEKKFDDGVLRRQELIKEIEYLREQIRSKDAEIMKYQQTIEKNRTDFFDITIKYTQLQGDYRDVAEKLEDLKREVNARAAQSAPPPIPAGTDLTKN